jgi:hypothetical protein
VMILWYFRISWFMCCLNLIQVCLWWRRTCEPCFECFQLILKFCWDSYSYRHTELPFFIHFTNFLSTKMKLGNFL